MKRWWIFFLAAALVSCAPFSREIMRQVDPLLTFDEVQKNPQNSIGKTVLWGGIIIETTNRNDGLSFINVRRTDLDAEGRPINPDQSRGRFLIRFEGFLDPAVYRGGRQITVAGEVIGGETLPIGNMPYVYPLVRAKAIRLWEQQTVYPYFPPWTWGPYWRTPYPPWPYYPPFW